MSIYNQLNNLLLMNNGIIETSQVLEQGITKPSFYSYVKDKKLEQVSHGIYASEDAWVDAQYILHLRYKSIIFSHETALLFHDLTDREPVENSVTVKSGNNTTRLKEQHIQVFTVKKELHEIGKITMATSFGNSVPVYDMERSICDIVRSRSKIEIQTFQNAIKEYIRRKDKDLRKLMKYAKCFHIEKPMKTYLEVLI